MRRHLRVFLAFVALSILLTWPLVAHFASHVPGDGIDDPSLAWNLWWAKHALVDQPQNPFAGNWIFWPVGINLAFYTLTLLNGLLSIPLQVVLGVVPAYNILLLASFALGGFGAYLLCLDFMGNRATRRDPLPARSVLPAFLGGALYAFASAKLFYAALGQGNVASSQWVPFAALYTIRLARPSGRLRDAGLAALFLILQAYAEQTYASFLVIFAGLVAVWSLWRFWRPDVRRRALPILSRFVLFGVLFMAGILPFLVNMLPDLRAEGDFFTSGGGFADVFSADLAGYALPTQLHPLFGDLTRSVAARAGFPVNKGQQIFTGYTALVLAAVGLVAGRRSRRGEHNQDEGTGGIESSPVPVSSSPPAQFWAVAALLFFLLTLGPTLRVGGHDLGVPLPFALVAQLPFFKGNRYPSRYSVMLLLSLAPLVALGTATIMAAVDRRIGGRMRRAACGIPKVAAHRIRGWRGRAGNRQSLQSGYLWHLCCRVGLLVLLLFEHLSVPLPIFDLRVPSLYTRVAQEPGDFTLLELPPGWRNGARVLGKQDTVIMQEMWNQTAHGKRLLGGNTSRNPEFKFQYFAENPTLARLIGQTNADDLPQHTALRAELAAHPVTSVDRERARQWAAFLRLRYVMVHRDKLPPATESTLVDLLPVRLVAEEGNLALYALDPLPAPAEFQPGTDAGRMVLGEGWSPAPNVDAAPTPALVVWAERSEARLLLPLLAGPTQIRLRLRAALPGQRVRLIVDGRSLDEQALGQELGWLTFSVPPNPARPPISDVRLRFAALAPISAVHAQTVIAAGSADRAPSLAGMNLPDLLVRSAGSETGDFAHIYVDGRDLSPDQRGYNLVALLPGQGEIRPANFDTHADAAASGRMAAWIAGLPAGTVVAGAVRDEAAMNLKPEAIQALQTLGVAGDLRGKFRWGHALIGVKGLAPGSASESVAGLRPAQTSLGLPVASTQVAAALETVAITSD